MTDTRRTALLLGATGLVGGHVLRRLAAEERWGEVVTLGRREMDAVAPKHTHHVIDFDRMDVYTERFDCDDVFCCLGTTIKQAGSKDAFRRVDFDYPVEAAYLAHAQGATNFLLISSLGADASSRIFYSRVKGETEAALRSVGFGSLSIFRPSLLTGERAETRRGEVIWSLGLGLATPLLIGPLRKYRSTPAKAVARVMVAVGSKPSPGSTIYESDAIMAQAQEM